jgi:hypothetical protein
MLAGMDVDFQLKLFEGGVLDVPVVKTDSKINKSIRWNLPVVACGPSDKMFQHHLINETSQTSGKTWAAPCTARCGARLPYRTLPY